MLSRITKDSNDIVTGNAMIRFWLREDPELMDPETWAQRVNEVSFGLEQLKNIISSLFK